MNKILSMINKILIKIIMKNITNNFNVKVMNIKINTNDL